MSPVSHLRFCLNLRPKERWNVPLLPIFAPKGAAI